MRYPTRHDPCGKRFQAKQRVTGSASENNRGLRQVSNADNSGLNELSGRVIGRAFTVHNTLGAGFLEKVYENALAYEVRPAGLSAA